MQHFEFFKRVIFFEHTLKGGNLFASPSVLIQASFFRRCIDFFLKNSLIIILRLK